MCLLQVLNGTWNKNDVCNVLFIVLLLPLLISCTQFSYILVQKETSGLPSCFIAFPDITGLPCVYMNVYIESLNQSTVKQLNDRAGLLYLDRVCLESFWWELMMLQQRWHGPIKSFVTVPYNDGCKW